ncbi:MAG TPA: hypothetical protein VF142_06160 [Longimicrobium sp.]
MIRRTFAALLLAASAFAIPAAAQTADTTEVVRRQVISLLPVHAILGFYAGEYERAVGQTATLGVGTSYFDLSDFTYATVEAKLRYYPSGDPLRGLSFGVTAGPTFLSEEGTDFGGGETEESVTALGVGVEIARSHILGVDRRFYYGYGFGAKRLVFVSDEAEGVEVVLPTLRLSVGYAF